MGKKWSEERKKKYKESGGRRVSEETKQKLREVGLKQFSTKKSREEHGKIIKGRMNNPEVKTKLSKAQTKRFTKPEELAKCASHGFDNKTHSDETKSKMSKSAKKLWEGEENYNKKLEKLRKTFLGSKRTPEQRKRMSDIAKKRWADPIYYEKELPIRLERLKGSCTRGKFSYYESKKSGIVYCRSNLERSYYQKLDDDPNVLFYEIEPLRLPYFFEGKERIYIPDVMVFIKEDEPKQNFYIDEVKPKVMLSDPQTKVKLDFAKDLWGPTFRIITEEEIFC